MHSAAGHNSIITKVRGEAEGPKHSSSQLDREMVRARAVGRSGNGSGGLWRLADELNPPEVGCRAMEAECIRRFHRHEPMENQCSSCVLKHIKAPVQLVRVSFLCLDRIPMRFRLNLDGSFAMGFSFGSLVVPLSCS